MEQRWRYEKQDGTPVWLPFDPAFPCIYCERPVGELSMGGPAVCPACDCGRNADGSKWSLDAFRKRTDNARRRIEALADDPSWAEYEANYGKAHSVSDQPTSPTTE